MFIPQKINVKTNFEKVQRLLNISKREVARRAGITPGSLDGILKHNNPKIKQLVSLSKGLGVSIRYLVEGGDPETELKENYVHAPLKPPTLRTGWKPEMPNVAARVEIILKKTGQTKSETSKKINSIPSWWSSVLKKNNPTMRMLERISYAINVEPKDLVVSVTSEEFSSAMMPIKPY